MSMVPKQRYSFVDKVSWLEEQIKRDKPDIVVTPQEFVSGVQCHFFADEPDMDQKVAYSAEEFLEPFLELSKRYDVGICTGSLIDDPDLNERRERIYVIDPDRGMTGFSDKCALPGDDLIDAKGKTKVYPETDISKRAVTHYCKGVQLGILFCWEFGMNFVWHAICRSQPDIVISMVKFGKNGYPLKSKNEQKESIVTGFGFGPDGGWMERLQMAAKWDVACPIIASTNSWRLPNRAGAICGMLLPWEEKATKGEFARPARVSTLWDTSKEKPAGETMKERVQVDQVDYLYWRLLKGDKFAMFEQIGEWPSSEARALTMTWKTKRIERRLLGLPKLQAEVGTKPAVRTPKGKHKVSETSVFES